jgi:hypothetical protein
LPRLPSQDPKALPVPPSPAAPQSGNLSHAEDPAVPRPIGPERLRALREAILNGTYPTESAVTGGLTQLFRQPAAAPSRPTPPAQDS